MKDEKRIFWGHTSWRSCRRGGSCMFPHSVMPAKNSPWLIRAQLAKRGGHRAHARIAPGAVPGYIDAIRETRIPKGGDVPAPAQKIWKPKQPTKKPAPADWQRDGTIYIVVNPAVGPVPSDFSNIGFASLEGDTGQLVDGPDEWTSVKEDAFAIPWRDRSALSDRQAALESWRDRHRPILQVNIEPWVMVYMDQSTKEFPMGVLKQSLAELSKKGSSKQRILPAYALVSLTQTKDGEHRATQSYWGLVQRRGDFASKELAIACFHFQVVDFSDSIPISESLMRSNCNTENAERNQCVLLHLAAGMLWGETGRKTCT